MDRRQQRGRGAAAGVLLDQGVRPAVQRQVPRRQVLPLPRGHDGRGVPARAGAARRQAQGHPLLRSLRPRLGDPRDPRPAAAGLPDAHLQQRRLQAGRAGGPPVPAGLHRQVLGAVRRPGRRRRAPGHRRGLLRLHGRQHRQVRQAARAPDEGRRRRDGLRAGGPAARRHRRAQPGAGEERRRPRATPPTPTCSPSPRTSSRPRSRCSTSAAAGSAASAAGWSRRRPRTPASWSSTSCSRCTAASRPRGCRARCSCPCCRPTPTCCRSGSAGCAGPRSTCGCRSAGTRRR